MRGFFLLVLSETAILRPENGAPGGAGQGPRIGAVEGLRVQSFELDAGSSSRRSAQPPGGQIAFLASIKAGFCPLAVLGQLVRCGYENRESVLPRADAFEE